MATAAETITDPFLTDEFHKNPLRILAELRENDPVHLIPELNAWVVTRYEDVRRLFADRFGEDKLTGGGELISVASGLALRARDLALA